MPGPVSESYDPEWGTSAVADEITDALSTVYDRVTGILGGRAPIQIQYLASKQDTLTRPISATMTEWEWRIIRFALERSEESI